MILQILVRFTLKLWIFAEIPTKFFGIIYICPGRKHPRLILNDFEFNLHIKDPNRTRWRCKNQNKTKCSAVLYTTGNVVKMKHSHNHQPKSSIDWSHLTPKIVKIDYSGANNFF